VVKITNIKAAVKTRGRFNIFVDGAYSFSLDESQLIQLGIRVGREYSEPELTELRKESEFGKAYARALEYIFRRARSRKEMVDYTWRKQWDKPLAERVLARLEAKGYIDDAKFAEAWVRHRSLGKPISLRKLKLELKQKGVADDVVADTLRRNDSFDESEALTRLIAKKRPRYPDEQKLIAYLLRQGYRYDDIKAAVASTDTDG
jgi:regulatory protein